MILNEHSDLRGKHAAFSPSQPSFFNSDPKEAPNRIIGKYRAQVGTDIHAGAFVKIKLVHKITSTKDMINSIEEFMFNKYYIEKYDSLSSEGSRVMLCFKKLIKQYPEMLNCVKSYVNDTIGYKMHPEVVLYFSDDLFGTSDALIFNKKDKLLRIHDLKTGATLAHVEQLMGYAALFCLEQHIDPMSINYELCIYQGNDILVATPDGSDVKPFYDWYVEADEALREFKGGLS